MDGIPQSDSPNNVTPFKAVMLLLSLQQQIVCAVTQPWFCDGQWS